MLPKVRKTRENVIVSSLNGDVKLEIRANADGGLVLKYLEDDTVLEFISYDSSCLLSFNSLARLGLKIAKSIVEQGS